MNSEKYYKGITDRHLGILTENEQKIISEAVICGAGSGGLGGWTYIALARLGCKNFKIADPETFDLSNVNRQAGSNSQTIGKNKAEAVAEEIKLINPEANVTVFSEGLTLENISSFLKGGSIVIDGVDIYLMKLKKALTDKALKNKIPVITSPIVGFGSALALFHPEKSPSFEQYFGKVPEKTNKEAFDKYIRNYGIHIFGFKPKLNWDLYFKQIENGKVPSVGSSCFLAGAMTVTGIVDYLLGKNNFPVVPNTIHIDLMQQKIVKIGKFKRKLLKFYVNVLKK